jgi:hypothetical protein
MTKIIEVLVLPDGKTKVQTKGFAGNECLQASKALEAALGHVTSDRLTSEFYCAGRQQINLRQSQS